MASTYVIKIGGHEIEDGAFLYDLALILRQMTEQIVVVHGGGKEISALQTKLAIEPRYVDGVRVTDVASMTIVQMVLGGLVNKRLVRQFSSVGIDTIGLTGVDRQLIRAHKMPHPTIDMGFTGVIDEVRTSVLDGLLQASIMPVIAPICYGDDTLYNVNADHVAGAIATAMHAENCVFLTNVEGVMVDDRVQSRLTVGEAEVLITNGVITGGMIPKVKTALHTLNQGVRQVMITNLHGLRTHTGTTIVSDQTRWANTYINKE